MRVSADEALRNLAIHNLRLFHVPTRTASDLKVGKGIHVSSLIQCLRRVCYEETSRPPNPMLVGNLQGRLKMALGVIIENGITLGETTQLEAIKDEIVGHADWDVEDLVEIKCTWNRASATPVTQDSWLKQMMSYTYLFDRLVCKLIVVHVAGLGTRKPIEDATIKAYRVDFEQEELDAHWAWMLQRKELLVSSLQNETVPSIEDAKLYDWQCLVCPHISNCLVELGELKRKELFEGV